MINKLLPEGLSDKGEEMVLNVSFLISREKLEEFQKVVRRLHDYYFPEGLWVEYTGPWPPFSFVNYGDKNKNPS